MKYRYLRCVDLKLWDELAEVFTPDATVDYGTQVYGKPLKLAGRDEIVGFLRDKLGPDMITVHRAGQPEITVDGDTAHGTWSFEDTVIATQYRVVITGAAFYQDRYERGEDGRWRIAHTGYVRTYEAMMSLDDLPSFRITAKLGEPTLLTRCQLMLTQAFAEALAEAEKLIAGAPFVASEQDLAEGYDYLAGSIQASLRLAWAYQRDFPYFVHVDRAVHQDGPGQPGHPLLPRLPAGRRRVRGHRAPRQHRRPELPGAEGRLLPGRGAGQPERVRRPGHRDRRGRHVRAAVRAVGEAGGTPSGSAPGRRCCWSARCTATGPPNAAARSASAARTGPVCAPPAAGPDAMAKRYGVAGKILLSRLRTFLAFPEWFYLKEPVNTMTPPRPTPGGLATQFSSAGHFDLGEDQAMIVTVPAAGRDVAPYQGIQLGSMWYVSLDYINHQTSLTADQARIDPDRRLRFVISERDPGVANWLELTGRRRGYVQIRWQRLTRDLTEEDGPRVEVVPFDRIAERLPYYDQARVSPPQWRERIAARQAAVAERMLG